MYKNLIYVLFIYLSPEHEFLKGIWMIHVVEEIKLFYLYIYLLSMNFSREFG
jgi:hypothetical protein